MGLSSLLPHLKGLQQQPNAKDYEFDATAIWNFAIDPSTATFSYNDGSGDLPSPIFDSGKPPVSISVKACAVNWATTGNLVATNPPQSPSCTGAQTTITLTPFGVGSYPVLLGVILTIFTVDQA